MIVTKDEIFAICRKKIISQWNQMPDTFPEVFSVVSKQQMEKNERTLEKLIQNFKSEQSFTEFWEKEEILHIYEYMGKDTFFQFESEIKSFVRQTRSFDDELDMIQIWQAMRNYLIYAMIVEMQAEKQEAKLPILCYSLLYPYTENYLDSASMQNKQKNYYNQLIADKISGKEVSCHSKLEEQTNRLLDGILQNYSSEELEQIRVALFALLEAQSESIQQQGKESALTEQELCNISVRKGSTSVLVDYFFSTMDWRIEEITFYLKFGFLLQLIDDFQDIAEDEQENRHTLMTQAKTKGVLEQRLNHLLWFIDSVMKEFEPRNTRIKPFVQRHCMGMVLITAAMNPSLLSSAYVEHIEKYLPFSIEYLKKKAEQLEKSQKNFNPQRSLEMLDQFCKR